MLSHQMRYYTPYISSNTHLTQSNRQGSSYTDVNRNSIKIRTHYQKKDKYFIDKNWNMNKSPYVIRSNVGAVIPYSPYPQVTSHQSYFSSPEKNDYIDRTGNGTKPFFPFEQVSDYCTEMLNRDKHFWTDEETGLMLELYEENRDYFVDSRTKKTKLWSVIANMINKKFSTNVNSEQCSQKYRNLKAEFLKVSETQSPETEKKFGKHYPQMKRLIEAEERFYQLQENNWLAKPDYPMIRSETETSPKKCSPSDNNNVQCEQNLPGNLQRVMRPETSSEPINRSAVLEDNAQESPIQAQTLESCPKRADNNFKSQDTPTSSNEDGSSVTSSPTEAGQCEETAENKVRDEVAEEPAVGVLDFTAGKALDTPGTNCETENSFTHELTEIFNDYMNSRKKMLESYEVKERENIRCMGRCVNIFYKVLKEKMKK